MNCHRITLSLMFYGTLVLSTNNRCEGQQRYQPSSPTVSPYLNLTRANSGGLPNYYSLVRPMIQQRAYDAREAEIRQQQQRQIEIVQGQLQLQRSPQSNAMTPTGKGSWFMNSGTRTTFQDTRRYYQQSAVIVGR